MPIDSAASVCPASIDCRPARTISAMKPAELNASATTPLQNDDSSKPMRGSAKYTRKICTSAGVPRTK